MSWEDEDCADECADLLPYEPQWQPFIEWWQWALQSVVATDREIQHECGAMYAMYLDQQWRDEK